MSNQPAKSSNLSTLKVVHGPTKSKERVHADPALDPSVNAAATVKTFGSGTMGKLEISETLEAVMEAVGKVRKGDMSGPEAILVAQASALNSIFTELARRAGTNMREYIRAMESYLRLALKAQAQCRAMIETLADMKIPRLVIARQANIANGPQQVNNGQPPRAAKWETSPNELLEQSDGSRLDAGTTHSAISGRAWSPWEHASGPKTTEG